MKPTGPGTHPILPADYGYLAQEMGNVRQQIEREREHLQQTEKRS